MPRAGHGQPCPGVQALSFRPGHAAHGPQPPVSQVCGDQLVGAEFHPGRDLGEERFADAQHVTDMVFFQIGAQRPDRP